MKFRKLRISWSVFWGLACVLLIVLWVRSQTWIDQVFVPLGHSTYFVFGSMPNTFGFGLSDTSPTGTGCKVCMATTDWLAALFDSSGTPPSTASEWRIEGGSMMMPDWFGVVVSAMFAVCP